MALTLINNTSTISFCDKECANITNNHFKKALFHILDTRYKISPVSNSIYVKIDCNKMKNITIHPHILTTLTNGNPYMLYFTIIDGRNVVLFIDRKKKENHKSTSLLIRFGGRKKQVLKTEIPFCVYVYVRLT